LIDASPSRKGGCFILLVDIIMIITRPFQGS
jgi:hypothetical protein